MASVTRNDVTEVFRIMLGRKPESEAAIAAHSQAASYRDLVLNVASSQEFQQRTNNSPFYVYNSLIDAEAIIRSHANPQARPVPGFYTNYLGVKILPKYLPEGLGGTEGKLEEIPIPGNWHADLAEWAAALRAVDLARGTFRMAELGCGWGCWMNNAGVAARRRGLNVELIGIDGDRGHIGFAMECCEINGFARDQVKILHGIAAAHDGIALFPNQEVPGVSYGLQPIFDPSPEIRQAAMASGHFSELPVIGLSKMIAERRLDLLHIDIQGGEADLIHSCRKILREQVAYIVVGAHSREIEGRIFEDLLGDGWLLEIERPAILTLTASGPKIRIDGLQGWRNAGLIPDSLLENVERVGRRLIKAVSRRLR
jgi:hypothetical protein